MRAALASLKTNISEIEKILPARNPIGNYTKTEEILLQAYYILVHAEIEELIEQCIVIKLNKIMSDYKNHRTNHIILLSLVFAFLSEDDTIKAIRKKGSIDNYLDYMNGKYRRESIQKNHGIKEDNLIKLFAPLGIDVQKFFSIHGIAEMEAMGSKRGEYAHHGLHLKVMEDPQIARARTLFIISELDSFVGKFEIY